MVDHECLNVSRVVLWWLGCKDHACFLTDVSFLFLILVTAYGDRCLLACGGGEAMSCLVVVVARRFDGA